MAFTRGVERYSLWQPSGVVNEPARRPMVLPVSVEA
jgi:hypothetical protein